MNSHMKMMALMTCYHLQPQPLPFSNGYLCFHHAELRPYKVFHASVCPIRPCFCCCQECFVLSKTPLQKQIGILCWRAYFWVWLIMHLLLLLLDPPTLAYTGHYLTTISLCVSFLQGINHPSNFFLVNI